MCQKWRHVDYQKFDQLMLLHKNIVSWYSEKKAHLEKLLTYLRRRICILFLLNQNVVQYTVEPQ